MHACGHDMHTAMLCSAARVLATRRNELAGRVLFMFQPGEEGFHGARHMIDEGLLDRTGPAGRPEAAYALHISATVPSGELHVRPGPLMAAADIVRVTVNGRGGHASAPHDALDPVPAAAAMVGALQTAITRRVDTHQPVVRHHRAHHRRHHQQRDPGDRDDGGHAAHAVRDDPDADARGDPPGLPVHRTGTRLRGRGGDRPRVPGHDQRRCGDGPRSGAVRGLLGPQEVVSMPNPIMGAEDFSYVLAEVPGRWPSSAAAAGGGSRPRPDSHSNRVMFDEDALASGVAVYAALALDALPR